MSSNIEWALLTRAIQDVDFHTLEKQQVSEEFFISPEMREIYKYIRDTYHNPLTAGLVPSYEMVRQRFPSFTLGYAPDPVPILCTELRREKVRLEVSQLAQKLALEVDADPMAAMATLKAQTQRLAAISEVGQDLSMAGAYAALKERYDLVASSSGVIGIPYPWAVLNEETQGMQNQQFIVLYGRPKSMKTWVSLYMAVYAYVSARRRVLFYTREMSPLQIAQRAAAAICGVPYKQFRNGTLQPEVREWAFEVLKGLLDDETNAGTYSNNQPYFIITADKGGGVSWLQAKIRELKPHIVFVDGMYLMKDDRSNSRSVEWKNIAHISQDLKLTAQEFDIPLVGITQANRGAEKSKGEDLTELAYADALGQDADAVFRVKRCERCDESTGGMKKTEIWVTAPGLREGKFDGIVINGEPATDFSYIRTLLATDEPPDAYGGNNRGGGRAPSASTLVRPNGATFSKRPQMMEPKLPI